MIAILEKSKHNVDFHQIVDFVEASHIRYALTINPTVYVSHIRQFWSTARIETTNEGTKILATADGKPRTISESSIRRNLILNDEEGISSLPDAPKSTGFNEFSSNFATVVGEGSRTPTEPHHTPSPKEQQSPHHDLSSSLHPTETTTTIPTTTPIEIPILRKYFRRATRIAQSKALPTAADEPASLFKDDSQGEAFPTARIKLLEDKDQGTTKLSRDDAPIKGRSLETEEEAGVEKSTKRGSNDTEELVNVLTSMDAANILNSKVQAVSVPTVAEIPTVGVPTGSGLVPTISAIFTTASVVTPYSRRKEMARDAQRMNEQIVRDAEIARIHAEEELQMMKDSLDRSNEMIAKHLHEYEQVAAKLTIGEKIELINELQQREFYMSVLRSYSGWKTKHFRGMTLEEIREKFIPVWKQIEDFVPMASKEEGKRVKRKGLSNRHATHHHPPPTPPSSSTPLYTLVTTTQLTPPQPPQQQQRRLFQPMPPSWWSVDGRLATTAAEQQSPHHDLSLSLHPTEITTTIPTTTPIEIPILRKYFRRATRIAQSKALPTAADEPASLFKDDSQGEAFPTQTEMVSKINAHDLEISSLKARIKLLEDKDQGTTKLSGDDAPIKGRSLETEEEAGVEKSTKRGSNDTEELVNVLTSMDDANILNSKVQAVSVPPVAEIPTVGVPTGSGLVPTGSAIFTTASVVTPYSRRKGEKIELINELVKYQDHHSKILKGMILEEIREKFIPVWKQIEDFVPMASKEEGKRVKRKGLRLEQGSAKKMKTSEEDLKEMMQLVHVEEVYMEALQMKYQVYGRIVGNKMLKSFSLPVMKIPLPEYFATASEEVFPLLS
nr:hypothetical protein [Tanacetum cinerariifolium]